MALAQHVAASCGKPVLMGSLLTTWMGLTWCRPAMVAVGAAPLRVGVRVEAPDPQLGRVRLGTVRAAFSPIVHQRSARLAYGWLAFDAALYMAFISGALRVHPLIISSYSAFSPAS